mgnify:CR=1 FL=1
MANALACSFLESDGEVSALRPEWEVLSRMAGSSDLLLSFGWYMAWRSVFGARLRTGVVAFRRNSALVGVMPLMLGRTLRSPSMVVRHDYLPGDDAFLTRRPRARFIPVRQLSPVLGLEATLWRGGPLAAPGNEADCYAALLRFLQEFSGWDVAVLPLPDSVARALAAVASPAGEVGLLDARVGVLEEDERRAVLFRHPVEDSIHHGAGFLALEVINGRRSVRRQLRNHIVFIAAAKQPAQSQPSQAMTNLVLRDSEQPGRDLGFAAKLGEQTVYRQKHILHDILDVHLRPTESSRPASHEIGRASCRERVSSPV